MKKTYVIDTNVLIHSPYAVEHFEDNDLVIPLVVVEELDALKKADGEKGANARQAVRLLESYRNILGRVENGRILPLVYKKCRPYGVTPRNVGQYFMQEALMADAQKAPLVIIKGMAGTAKTYLIIDEAQNMTPNQVKDIITRTGKGKKIILLGDPNQIDKPFLDEKTNGLSYAAKHMKGSPYCYQITLGAEEFERSQFAMDAVKRL